MITFLDFDGVIIDSIDECYEVSSKTYYGYAKFPYDKVIYQKLFYEFRGLVKPAYEYLYLHKAIEEFILGSKDKVDILFANYATSLSKIEAEEFEKSFFFMRSLYQHTNYIQWINMNPLTSFGKQLIGKDNEDIYIVTTKNRQAVVSILKHYKISYSGIYANEDIKKAGSKGNLLTALMDRMKENSAVFVDDAVEHLDTVHDTRVTCYFADWGYGINNRYKVYKF